MCLWCPLRRLLIPVHFARPPACKAVDITFYQHAHCTHPVDTLGSLRASGDVKTFPKVTSLEAPRRIVSERGEEAWGIFGTAVCWEGPTRGGLWPVDYFFP